MDTSETNIVRGEHTRKLPKEGQGFFFEVRGVGFLLGRVITKKAVWSPAGARSGYANLIYIYKDVYPTLEQALNGKPTELLIPQILTNNLPWVRGFLKYLPENANVTFPPPQERHCFVSHRQIDYYYDEHGTPVTEPWQPLGELVSTGYLGIDADVSKALGIKPIEIEPQ